MRLWRHEKQLLNVLGGLLVTLDRFGWLRLRLNNNFTHFNLVLKHLTGCLFLLFDYTDHGCLFA